MSTQRVAVLSPLAACAAALVAAGCTSVPRVGMRPLSPPPESVRARVTSLTVQVGYQDGAKTINQPWGVGEAMGNGALGGAAMPMIGGAYLTTATAGADFGIFTLLGIVLAPVGAVVGAIVGPVNTMPSEEREKYLTSIQESMAHVSPADGVAWAFATHATDSSRVQTEVSGGEHPCRMEMTVLAFGLVAENQGVDPLLNSFVVVRGRLKQGEEVLHELTWEGLGQQRRFQQWAEWTAADFNREFDRVAADVGNQAAEEMFELVVIP